MHNYKYYSRKACVMTLDYFLLISMAIFKLFLSGYLGVSCIAFCFPQLLRRKVKYRLNMFNEAIEGQRILRIAHRGGPRHTTENTIEAFQNSAECSDVLEMDVCETKDRVLVVHHDIHLERTCGSLSTIDSLNHD